MARHHILFVKDGTDEEKLANIIISNSLLEEVLGLWLTNHFFKINNTSRNEKDRDDFVNLILKELSFRNKSDIVANILGDKSGVRDFKTKLYKVGEIRNKVAHNTGWLGTPNNVDGLYKEFDEIMHDLENFIDLAYREYQNDMDNAYM